VYTPPWNIFVYRNQKRKLEIPPPFF
jgi:hypothetical protein